LGAGDEGEKLKLIAAEEGRHKCVVRFFEPDTHQTGKKALHIKQQCPARFIRPGFAVLSVRHEKHLRTALLLILISSYFKQTTGLKQQLHVHTRQV